MNASYEPPAAGRGPTTTIEISDHTTVRTGPADDGRVWLQVQHRSTFVAAVLDVDQVARLVVGIRRAAGSAAGNLVPVQRGDHQYDRGDAGPQGTGRPWRGARHGYVVDDTGTLVEPDPRESAWELPGDRERTAIAEEDAAERAQVEAEYAAEEAAQRRPYVTPGHPTREAAGYDCHCGECLYQRTRRGESS